MGSFRKGKGKRTGNSNFRRFTPAAPSPEGEALFESKGPKRRLTVDLLVQNWRNELRQKFPRWTEKQISDEISLRMKKR